MQNTNSGQGAVRQVQVKFSTFSRFSKFHLLVTLMLHKTQQVKLVQGAIWLLHYDGLRKA